MIEIESGDYCNIARKAAAAIGSRQFFSGTVECAHDRFFSSLTATLLIYRRGDGLPEGPAETVCDVVPVWWEFSAVGENGSELPNDFSFSEFREHLMDYFRTEVA